MGELLNFPDPNKDSRNHALRAVRTIGQKAIGLVTNKYGDGGESSKLWAREADLAYHNKQHTLQVIDSAVRTGQALGLNDHDLAIIEVAAAAHDVIQLKQRGEMEQDSAKWLHKEMTLAGFSPVDIEAAELAILGTEPVFNTEGAMVGQFVSRQEYPSQRAELIAKSVAIGDMADLYSPVSPLRSRDLYKEILGVPSFQDPPIDRLLDFQHRQLQLLQTYRFPHPIGEELFSQLRYEVFNHQMWITQQLHIGRITSWQEVIEQDREFMEQHQV